MRRPTLMNGGPAALARHLVAVTDEMPRSAHSCFSSISGESMAMLAERTRTSPGALGGWAAGRLGGWALAGCLGRVLFGNAIHVRCCSTVELRRRPVVSTAGRDLIGYDNACDKTPKI